MDDPQSSPELSAKTSAPPAVSVRMLSAVNKSVPSVSVNPPTASVPPASTMLDELEMTLLAPSARVPAVMRVMPS